MNLAIERQYPHTIQINKKDTLTYTLYHVTTAREVEEMMRWCEGRDEILIDTETSGIDVFTNHLATIQVGHPAGEHPAAFVIDYRLLTPDELAPFYALLANPKVVKLGQNIKFELLYLNHRAHAPVENVKDTFITEFCLRAGLFPERKARATQGDDDVAGMSECSMAALARRYLGLTIDKGFEVRTSFYTTPAGTYSNHQLEYAAGDVIYPWYIFQEQMLEIHARKLAGVLDVEFQFIPVAAEIQLRGLQLDTVQWRSLWQEAEAKRQEAEDALHALLFNKNQQELFASTAQPMLYHKGKGNRRLSFDSPEQLKWAVKQYCANIGWSRQVVTSQTELNKLKLKYGNRWIRERYEQYADRTKAKGETPEAWAAFLARELDNMPEWLIPDDQYTVLIKSDKDTLKLAQITGQLPSNVVDLLLNYSRFSIAAGTFGNAFITKNVNQDDGRVHPEVRQNMTTTGRTSMSPNLQQIPSDQRYRHCFTPTPGYKFVIADYSQQEPRITAQESQDPVYLRTFQNDEDIYINVAEAMLGYRPDPDSPDPEFRKRSKRDRQLMKQVVLAMAYRMGPRKLYHKLLLAFADEILKGNMEPPTYEEVKALHAKFLATFTKLAEYQNFCSTAAHPTQTQRPKIWDRMLGDYVTWATARCGRKRFFRPDATNTYTEAANSPIQGCAATMSKAAAVLVRRYIQRNGIEAWPVDIVHDELVYECREDQAQAFAQAVQKLMERAGKFYLPDVPIKADFPKNSNGVVDRWTKEVQLAA